MGAWRELVDELESAIREAYDPSDYDNSEVLSNAVDLVMPFRYHEFFELVADNMDIYRFETQSNHKTPEEIITEAVAHLLNEEGSCILSRISLELTKCISCAELYFEDKSNATNTEFYCSKSCEFDDNGSTCGECGNQYLTDESLANASGLFCSGYCEIEYNKICCNNCDYSYLEEDSDAYDSSVYCSLKCECEDQNIEPEQEAYGYY